MRTLGNKVAARKLAMSAKCRDAGHRRFAEGRERGANVWLQEWAIP